MNTNYRNLLALAAVATAIATAGTRPSTTTPDLGWLVGHWCGERDGDFIEEQWLGARGDLMLGLSRTVRGEKTRNFEYMRIQSDGATITFIAQPNGAPPTPFALTAAGSDWARFENPTHDFPSRVEYRRTSQGLHAEIAGPGDDGRERVIPFDYAVCAQ
jgi:hypothetical protein